MPFSEVLTQFAQAPPVFDPSEIDRRIKGKTASVVRPIYSSINRTTRVYVRNTDCWINDISGYTGLPVRNSAGLDRQGNSAFFGAMLVTPRHVLLAYHTVSIIGDTFDWVTSANVTVTRTLADLVRIGSTDIVVGRLDSDLPATIVPALSLPSDYASYVQGSGKGLPLLALNQEQYAAVCNLTTFNLAGLGNVQITAGGSYRGNFYQALAAGDSGHPICGVCGSALYAVAQINGLSGASDPVNHDLINSTITSLGSSGGYQLTDIDLAARAEGAS